MPFVETASLSTVYADKIDRKSGDQTNGMIFVVSITPINHMSPCLLQELIVMHDFPLAPEVLENQSQIRSGKVQN